MGMEDWETRPDVEAVSRALAEINKAKECSFQELVKIWRESGVNEYTTFISFLTLLEGRGCTIDLDKGICHCPIPGEVRIEQGSGERIRLKDILQEQMPEYERKLQDATTKAIEAVKKAPADSLKMALEIEKVAKANDVKSDDLIRRVVTEDRIKLTSVSPDTYRVVLEGKEIGPVLSEEEKSGAVTFTRCIMHQFLGQPDWCIKGYEEGKYEVREGKTVEKATGKTVEGCYSPMAVCRASVFGEYA